MNSKTILRVSLAINMVVVAGLIAGALFFGAKNAPSVYADDNCQNFPDTGYNVCGRFLAYFQSHGGIPQQGLPISDVFEEQNQPPPAGDGKIHRVQYFERARFEEHLEAQPPYDVQLGLLGSEQYNAKYKGGSNPAQSGSDSGAGQELIGQSGSQRNLNAKVTGVDRFKQIKGTDGKTVTAYGVFLVVSLNVTNNGDTQDQINLVNLVDSNGRRFGPTLNMNVLSAVAASGKYRSVNPISGGTTGPDYKVFEVPADAGGFSITFGL